MTDTSVSAETVVAIYKEKLAEANHKIVMLQAAIIDLEDKVREFEDVPTESQDSE